MTTHSSILASKIPRMEEPVGYSPWGHKELDTTERLSDQCVVVVIVIVCETWFVVLCPHSYSLKSACFLVLPWYLHG